MKSQYDTKFKLLIVCVSTLLNVNCSHTSPISQCKPQTNNVQDKNFQVQTLSYSPRQSSQKTLLIIPPTGGTNIIDRSYATDFCKDGYHVHILNSWTGDTETVIDFEIHQRFYSNAQKAISAVLNQVNTPFVGLMGTSVGGLHASIAASTQERIDAVFAITAGTPVAEVVVYSQQGAMIDLNKRRKEKFNTTNNQDQVNRISQVFQLEPTQQGALHQKKDLGLAIALKDTVVPTEQQEKLRRFWNPKAVIEIKNDHFFGILKTWAFHSDQILAFFNKSFESKN